MKASRQPFSPRGMSRCQSSASSWPVICFPCTTRGRPASPQEQDVSGLRERPFLSACSPVHSSCLTLFSIWMDTDFTRLKDVGSLTIPGNHGDYVLSVFQGAALLYFSVSGKKKKYVHMCAHVHLCASLRVCKVYPCAHTLFSWEALVSLISRSAGHVSAP